MLHLVTHARGLGTFQTSAAQFPFRSLKLFCFRTDILRNFNSRRSHHASQSRPRMSLLRIPVCLVAGQQTGSLSSSDYSIDTCVANPKSNFANPNFFRSFSDPVAEHIVGVHGSEEATEDEVITEHRAGRWCPNAVPGFGNSILEDDASRARSALAVEPFAQDWR